MKEYCESAKKGLVCPDSICRGCDVTLCGFDKELYAEICRDYDEDSPDIGWVRRSELTQEEWDAAESHALRYPDGRMDIVDGPDLPDPEFGLRCCDLDGNDGAVALALVSAPVAGGGE